MRQSSEEILDGIRTRLTFIAIVGYAIFLCTMLLVIFGIAINANVSDFRQQVATTTTTTVKR